MKKEAGSQCKHLDLRILRRYEDILVECRVCGMEAILPYKIPFTLTIGSETTVQGEQE